MHHFSRTKLHCLTSTPTRFGARRWHPQGVPSQLLNFPAVAMFTTVCHWSQSCATFIQSTPHHSVPVRPISILSSRIRLSLSWRLIRPGFPAHIWSEFVHSPYRSTCSANLVVADIINGLIFCGQYELWSFSLHSFLQASDISFFDQILSSEHFFLAHP